jgi:hypothetical protein
MIRSGKWTHTKNRTSDNGTTYVKREEGKTMVTLKISKPKWLGVGVGQGCPTSNH